MAPGAQPPATPAFPLSTGEGAVAVAFARHLDAPAVGSHIDLFVGPPGAQPRDARVARAFRLPLVAFAEDAPIAGSYDAVELEPHRAEYLWLDAPRELAHARGRVEPLLQTAARATVRDDAFELRWNGWHARAARVAAERWTITLSRDRAPTTQPNGTR